jgi:hypothetical protein
MCRVYAIHEENMYTYRVLMGKPEGKRPVGRSRSGRIILKMI